MGIKKYLQCAAGVVIVTDAGTKDDLKEFIGDLGEGISIYEDLIPPSCTGYLWQQAIKMKADLFCPVDWEYIVFVDSDTVLSRPFAVTEFFNQLGQVIWPYDLRESFPESHPWFVPTEKFIGSPIDKEFMRKMPIVVPSALLSRIREFCLKQHFSTVDFYISSQKPEEGFSEFNVMGAYAYEHNDSYQIEFIQSSQYLERYEKNLPHRENPNHGFASANPWIQFWSWGGPKKILKK